MLDLSERTVSRIEPPHSLPRKTKTIRIMLPAFNEADALPTMLEDFDETFGRCPFPYHVTIVDDGSTDDTVALIRQGEKEFPVSLISHPQNRGLAAAMRTGLTAVSAEAGPDDIIITMDSDNTHPIGLMPRMIEMIHEGRDIVVASRFRPGSRVMGVPRFRQVTAFVAGKLFAGLFPIPGIRDYTCGYRAYRADAIKLGMKTYGEKFISEEGFSCMVDLLLKLSRLNLICGEAPMVLRYDQKVGESKMPVGKTIFATLRLAAKRRMGILD